MRNSVNRLVGRTFVVRLALSTRHDVIFPAYSAPLAHEASSMRAGRQDMPMPLEGLTSAIDLRLCSESAGCDGPRMTRILVPALN